MRFLDPLLRPIRRRLDGELRVLAKNSSWVFLANAFRTLLAFAKSVIIARGLGVELYGTFVLVLAFVMTTQEFFNLNLGTAVIKFGADYRGENRLDKLVALAKASAAACAGLAVLSVIAVAAVSTVAYDSVVGAPGLEVYVVLYALVGSITFFDSVSTGLLRLFYRFRLNSIVQMTTAVIDFVFVATVLFLFPHQLEPFLVAMILAKLLDSGVINGAALWEMWGELKGSRRAPIRLIREDRRTIGAFVLSNSGSRTLKTLMDRGDVLLLGALSSSQQVGLYDIAKKLAAVVLRFTDPLVSSIFPQISRLLAERRIGEVKRMLKKLTAGVGSAALPVLVAAYFLGEWVMVTLYGGEFAPGADVFVVHLASMLFAATIFWGLPLIHSLNLITERLRITAIMMGVGAAVGYLVAPAYGALGMAATLLFVKVVISSDMLLRARRKMGRMQAEQTPAEVAVAGQG